MAVCRYCRHFIRCPIFSWLHFKLSKRNGEVYSTRCMVGKCRCANPKPRYVDLHSEAVFQ